MHPQFLKKTNQNIFTMTKADIVSKISDKSGIEKADVLATVEAFMEEVKEALENGDNVYLRGFGSFIIKQRAEKTGRNISKNTTIKIPAHNIPAFKPSKVFTEGVKAKVAVK
ncbi:HU, DNA-binding transcriptional regulator, alpha subunit [Tenacibaculum halocynthiae]|nr:DNA-binding protein HU-beta [Tenacibaculum sp. MAR_2010_89]